MSEINEIDIERIKRLANNTLYFEDNSDYETALWAILEIVDPENFDEEGEVIKDLMFINDCKEVEK